MYVVTVVKSLRWLHWWGVSNYSFATALVRNTLRHTSEVVVVVTVVKSLRWLHWWGVSNYSFATALVRNTLSLMVENSSFRSR